MIFFSISSGFNKIMFRHVSEKVLFKWVETEDESQVPLLDLTGEDNWGQYYEDEDGSVSLTERTDTQRPDDTLPSSANQTPRQSPPPSHMTNNQSQAHTEHELPGISLKSMGAMISINS